MAVAIDKVLLERFLHEHFAGRAQVPALADFLLLSEIDQEQQIRDWASSAKSMLESQKLDAQKQVADLDAAIAALGAL